MILLVLLHIIRQQANPPIILITNFLIKIERKDITSRALKYLLSVIHQGLVQHLDTCYLKVVLYNGMLFLDFVLLSLIFHYLLLCLWP